MKRHRWDCINDRIKHIENPVGAEIGVHRGECSGNLLRLHPGLKLYMIDTWAPDTYKGKGDDAATEPFRKIYQEECEINRRIVLELSEKYENAIMLPMSSKLASDLFNDHSLDFCFIDASHDYESVKSDIKAWLPKVKHGGFMAFHDYGLFEGVNKAVYEMFSRDVSDRDLPMDIKRTLECELDEDYMCFVRV